MGRVKYTGTNSNGDTLDVVGVMIDPSGASWVFVVTDAAGKVVFSARGSDAVSRFYPVSDRWVGANCTTATNLTAVYIYTR